MTGAIAHDQAQRLRAAVDDVLRESEHAGVPESVRGAFLHLVDVLESSADAVVFPADSLIGTGQAADLLGVSRMTVVRLIDRGELTARGAGVHRRIAVSELARYQATRSARRRSALTSLASEIGDDTAPDQVITTR